MNARIVTKRGKRVTAFLMALLMTVGLLFNVNLTAYAADEGEPNNTLDSAKEVSFDEKIEGEIANRYDVDYYKFTALERGYVTLSMEYPTPKSSYDPWRFDFMSSTGELLYTWQCDSRAGGKNIAPAFGVDAGTYYICVSLNQTGLKYELNLDFTASDEWEVEGNNSIQTATPISLGKNVNGTLYETILYGGFNPDKDYFAFTIDQPGDVQISFSKTCGKQLKVDCYDASGNKVQLKKPYYGLFSRSKMAEGTYYLYLRREDNTRPYEYSFSVTLDIPNAQLYAFVTRMYEVVLGRTPDKAGLNDWVNRLLSGDAKAVDIVQGFMCSEEYLNKGKSNGEIVNDCYNAMLGRAADEGGYNDWVTRLDNGMSVQAIFAGFVGSQEFGNLCQSYGIEPGTYNVTEPRDQNQGVTAYVARLYTQALGRNYDAAGLNDWCGQIIANPSRDNIIQVAANGFFHSDEFTNKNLDNTEYVKVLYRTFLGRECDEAGLADWVGQLDAGASRDDILPGFANSQEFSNIMAQYGL